MDACSIRPHRWEAEPMPALARLTLPWFLPIQSLTSAKFLAGRLGRPIRVMGTSLMMPAYSKSLSTLNRSEEHTSELQSQSNLVCRLLLEKKKRKHLLQIL